METADQRLRYVCRAYHEYVYKIEILFFTLTEIKTLYSAKKRIFH